MKSFLSMIALSSMLISGAAFASKMSNVDLGGLTILPNSAPQSLSYAKLVPGMVYDITCEIQDPNFAKNPVSLAVSTSMGVPFYSVSLNGTVMATNVVSFQHQLTAMNNTLVLTHQFANSNSNALTFETGERDDTITVTDCMATTE